MDMAKKKKNFSSLKMSVVGTTFLRAINHCLKFHSHLPKSGICQFFPVKTTDKMHTYVFNVFKDIIYLIYEYVRFIGCIYITVF